MRAHAEAFGPLGPERAAALAAWVDGFVALAAQYGTVLRAWADARRDGNGHAADILGDCIASLAERIRGLGDAELDPDVAARSVVAVLDPLGMWPRIDRTESLTLIAERLLSAR
jgi:hypothetical protein